MTKHIWNRAEPAGAGSRPWRLRCLGKPENAQMAYLGFDSLEHRATARLVSKEQAIVFDIEVPDPDPKSPLRRFKEVRSFAYIDGDTTIEPNYVRISTSTDSYYSGINWIIHGLDAHCNIECRGSIEGPRWLFGDTGNGFVRLLRTWGVEGGTWTIESTNP